MPNQTAAIFKRLVHVMAVLKLIVSMAMLSQATALFIRD